MCYATTGIKEWARRIILKNPPQISQNICVAWQYVSYLNPWQVRHQTPPSNLRQAKMDCTSQDCHKMCRKNQEIRQYAVVRVPILAYFYCYTSTQQLLAKNRVFYAWSGGSSISYMMGSASMHLNVKLIHVDHACSILDQLLPIFDLEK